MIKDEFVNNINEVRKPCETIKIPIEIDENNVIEGARNIVKVLRPSWNCENVNFKLFTDGITNKLVGCFHTKFPLNENHINTNGHQSDANEANHCATTVTGINKDVILVRVYGNKTDLLIDRKAEQRNIKFLQSYGFAPELYATFQNGLVYEYIPGCTLKPETIVLPQIWKLIARKIAQMHRIDHGIVKPEPMLWNKFRQFLNLLPETFSDSEKNERIHNLQMTIPNLTRDINELHEHVMPFNSPVVFCHNDLLLGNVIYTESEQKVTFIDFEYAAVNHQAFDIGNHFTEFAGIDDVDYNRYPTKDFQFEWLRVYLETFLDSDSISNELIHRLYVQVNKFALTSHLFWTVWALIQAEHSTIDFDFVKFAQIRYYEYLAKKEEFFALQF